MSSTRQHVDDAQVSAIARLFSSSVVRELGTRGRSPAFARLSQKTGLHHDASGVRVRDFFEEAYAVLARQGQRTEHVYKTAILHKVLLGTHSLRTATMLTELRVADCRADVVILNGTSTAYEVKSERDGLHRLERQVGAYRKVFAQVSVIAGHDHVAAVIDSVPADVGVLRLSGRGSVSTIREAINAPERIEPSVLFDSLRRDEAVEILRLHGVAVPQVPNTEVHRMLRGIFASLSPAEAHDGFVRVLRKTRSVLGLAEFLEGLPRSLRAAALPVRLGRADRMRLLDAMNVTMDTALTWA
jgi:hypothetical protein